MINDKKFYVIATPIGNMQEVNPRIIDSIKKCSYLFCEDTRVTQKFLNLINLTTPWPKLISYHKFNEKIKLNSLLKLVDDFTCGLISDAGYPSISDPGKIIINEIRQNLKNVKIEVINCASAVLCALVGSGFNNQNFYFHGFLNKQTSFALNELTLLKKINTTLIIFESVHRIIKTLNLIKKIFLNNKICVARELTKKNETYYFGTIDEIIDKLIIKGEFVILIDNTENLNLNCINNQNIVDIQELVNLGLRLKDACKFIAKKENLNASDLYEHFQKEKYE
ncbi:16S rRNA (cytidine(1402)-2'-O)-methyltransferase [Mycoplasmoides alvi]|uniref:16S rRNA (cytidine(1402)-2'-O)-methyltransferase n=1 Tax=Mycoplasmoides alvi TaxID=78580 RepID=UPI00051C8347|nr:16S rRNA (cytidine(1402)-2'-O)-methyltransferase [Mycoplasmoides alvi]